MATEKLFLQDSLALEFEAQILGAGAYEGKPSLLLDRSAFYGQAGGQLGDRGKLHSSAGVLDVIDTQIDADGALHHLLEQPAPASWNSGVVKGEVDYDRRRDMMSQHTGQHMVSAAFARVADLDTISARLGSEISTIDLPGKVEWELLEQVEDRVNELVLENRPIKPIYPTDEELAQLPMRRRPKVTENIRLINIRDFDMTPCGGTHCSNTGQVGLVRMVGVERYKGNSRISFVAGKRALIYLRNQDNMLKKLASDLSCAAGEIGDVIAKWRRELREQSNQTGKIRAELMGFLCSRLHEEHPPTEKGPTLIVSIREEDDPASARKLASALARRPDVLALAACRDPKSDGWSVVVERGEACEIHVGNWFREQSAKLGGRGGGRPERAEGRWPATVDWSQLEL